jgi:hypothetical protein
MFRRKTIGYTSNIDKFLLNYSENTPPSQSQQDEIKKYQRIYELRDKLQTERAKQSLL